MLLSSVWASVTGIYSPRFRASQPFSLRPVQTRPNQHLHCSVRTTNDTIFHILFLANYIITYTTASTDAVWECVLCFLYELAHPGSLLESSAVGQSRPAHSLFSLPPPLLSPLPPSSLFLFSSFPFPTFNNTGKFCEHLLLFLFFQSSLSLGIEGTFSASWWWFWGFSPALLICASSIPSALVVSKFIVILARDCLGDIDQLANPHDLFI